METSTATATGKYTKRTQDMVDFHSHILPGVDDGSRSVEESSEMLRCSAAQGITTIAATPHFYANEDTPEHFLERRRNAAEKVAAAWEHDFPELRLGAEVYYYAGIRATDELYKLCLEGTDLLLLEMPFHTWSRQMVGEVVQLNQGLQVVLAHVDRYLKEQPLDTWERLLDAGVLFQANADSFLNWRKRRKILRMAQNGWITFLGSDCHNLTDRPPCMDQALDVLKNKLGADFLQEFLLEESRILHRNQMNCTVGSI